MQTITVRFNDGAEKTYIGEYSLHGESVLCIKQIKEATSGFISSLEKETTTLLPLVSIKEVVVEEE